MRHITDPASGGSQPRPRSDSALPDDEFQQKYNRPEPVDNTERLFRERARDLTFADFNREVLEHRINSEGRGELLAMAFAALGITGEAGEVADKVKKIVRGDYTISQQRIELAKELGDVLWYIVNLADQLGFTLQEIAQMNNDKLRDRRSRNASRGEGDNR